MATSGSIDYSQTRTEVIEDAFQLIGVYGLGRTVSAEDMELANSILNKMVKAWQARGLHLWAKEEAYLFVDKDVASYTLSNAASAAKATRRDDAVITKLTADLAGSGTSLTVGDTTGMATSDSIGIELDTGSIHWTTISSVDSGTTLTIASGPATAAASGKHIYTFTTRINKPMRILSVRRKVDVGDGSTSIPMVALSHQQYFDLPNKETSGLSNHYYYNPDVEDGTLYLWPRPEDAGIHLEFTYERMIEDLDAAGNTFDFPSEWLECMTYQLAVRLAPAFGKDQKAIALLVPMATDMYQQLLEWDSEVESIQFMPDTEY